MRLHVPHGLIGSPYRFAKALWPHVAIAMLLPGGSILAFTLWLLRRIRNVRASSSETTSLEI
jgi:hypothetical protein